MQLPSKQVTHRDWMIRSIPDKQGFHFHARVSIERGPCAGERNAQRFSFTDIGYFDTAAAADDRGVEWARSWIDSNF